MITKYFRHCFIFLIFMGMASTTFAAFPSGWTRSCAITVQHAQVSGNLTDFPVLVSYGVTASNETNLPSEMLQTGNANAAQADGGDIRFTSDPSGTLPLHYEIVTFSQNADVAHAKAEIWVKIPELSSSTDTTFYIWYHSTSVQTTPDTTDPHWGSRGVWDQHYVGVWHFKDSATIATNDSTLYANHGTNGGANPGAGQINGAADFNGSSHINTGNAVTLQTSSALTVSTWVKFTTLDYLNNGGDLQTFASKGRADSLSPTTGWWFSYDNRNNRKNFAYTCFGNTAGGYSGGGNNFGSVQYTFSNGVWYHIAIAVTPSSGTIYVNGIQQGSVAFANTDLRNSIDNFFIGRSNSTSYYMNGALDEVRISSHARSAQWIATEYNNQNSPHTFLSIGTPGVAGVPKALSCGSFMSGLNAVSF